MTLDYEELIRKAEQLGLSAADLNGTIRDAAAELAVQITDTGLAMQLHFLSRDCGWGKSRMEEQLEEITRRKPSAGIEELERKARELGLKPDDLDEVIHDVASDIASSINNQGLYGQIAYWAKEETRVSTKSTKNSRPSPGRNANRHDLSELRKQERTLHELAFGSRGRVHGEVQRLRRRIRRSRQVAQPEMAPWSLSSLRTRPPNKGTGTRRIPSSVHAFRN
jgi:hypothetical protein